MATPEAGKKPLKEEKTAEYEVASRLDHDGTVYEPGSTVTLTEKQAEPLLGGAIKAK